MAVACCSIRSCSLVRMIRNYDVFVSFRGKDTRNNFTDHLFGALEREDIYFFRDETMIRKGKYIAPELLQAIEKSRVFVVIFSKNYASSTWCLGELTKILDCLEGSGKHVLPIFFDVSPSVVRKQKKKYKNAFIKHERRFKNNSEMMLEVKRWRKALTHVAGISGWEIGKKPQYKLIKEIVEEISSMLSHNPDDLVGMLSPFEELDVRFVGIRWESGIEKTTLTTVLYDRISHQYEACCCFIDDVSRIYEYSGPIGVQKQLPGGQTLEEENLQICSHYNAANLIRNRLHHVRALLVFNNVDRVEKLETLFGSCEWLDAGSRIILISGDDHILKKYGTDLDHHVQHMNNDDALKLFCTTAFKHVNIKGGYEKLTYEMLKCAKGHSLAIEVLGSFLCDRDVSEWESALARLKENSSINIMDVLRLSFDGLGAMEKEIFLDIACFFNQYWEPYVKKVLNCCELDLVTGIKALSDKSFLSIKFGSYIEVHALLRKLGKKIVQENSTNEFRKWSRLWVPKYFENVIGENMEENVEAIVITWPGLKETEKLMAETLSKMICLRLLILNGVKFSGSLYGLSNKLRYVEWYEYPFTSLPSSFQPNQLIELILQHSNIIQLWRGKKDLPSLKTLDLSHSKNLIKMIDFGEIPNVEKLNLEGCLKLVELASSSNLPIKLISMNLKDCKSLISVPNNILDINSLIHLNLSGCSEVLKNHMHVEHLKKHDTSETISRSQSTLSVFKRIIYFWYPGTDKDLSSTSLLLPSFPSSSCLCELDISFCGLSQIPDAIGNICCLERLNLGGNNFVKLPRLKELSKLVYLNLQHCKELESLPELPIRANLPLRRQLEEDQMLTNSRHWRIHRAGLYIFNCPKLDERECCRTSSWMTQVIQVNQNSSTPFDEIDIVIPGSVLPQWFDNRSVGSSISLGPSVMHDNNCLGIVCCAVFVAHRDPTTLRIESKPFVGIGFECKGHVIFADIELLLDRDLVTVESDHMWLFFFTQKTYVYMMDQTRHRTHDLDGIKLATFTGEGQGLRLEVKSCGYRFLFEKDEIPNLKDLELSNSTRKRKSFFFN